MALSRRTRQVVAYAIGDRSKVTCRKLWEAIPEAYRRAHCYSDFWKAYAAVIPAEQHTAVGIRSGQTAHVERFNNTLRQRLGRLVRQTLSFSKSVVMHEACLSLFFTGITSSVPPPSDDPPPGREEDSRRAIGGERRTRIRLRREPAAQVDARRVM